MKWGWIFTCMLGGTLGFGLLIQGVSAASPRPVVSSAGLVLDESGLDNPMNEMSNQALQRIASDFSVETTVYTATNADDYENQFQACVDGGNLICVGTGSFMMFDAIANVAVANPTISFALLDSSSGQLPQNVREIAFDYKEMGYLAGALAGLMTESDIVGAVGGLEFVPAVAELVGSYRNAAQCINPYARVLVSYADSFVDPEQGAALAGEMISQGADVVFSAAGPTGDGAMLAAAQAGEWVIGVDSDQYHDVFEDGAVDGADKLLSSAMKHIDTAVYDTIADVLNDEFIPGIVVYDLDAGGVGLAPYHDAGPFVLQAVRDRLAEIEQALINGQIDLDDPCRSNLYLPLVPR